MNIEGYCEDCPIIKVFSNSIRYDNPELGEEELNERIEDCVQKHGMNLRVLCDVKLEYIDLRDHDVCQKIINKDGDEV